MSGGRYYAITLTADEECKVVFGVQSSWVGWEDEDRKIEIRRGRLLEPQFVELWERLEQPFYFVHTIDDLTLFFIGDGNAMVEESIATQVLGHLLGEDPVVPVGRSGFRSKSDLKTTAFNKAPSAKLRMRVLTRDGRRCRICGRSPRDNTDVELHLHHIRPWANRGITDPTNLVTLCHTCHKVLEPHEDLRLFNYLDDSWANSEKYHKGFLEAVIRYRSVGLIGDG